MTAATMSVFLNKRRWHKWIKTWEYEHPDRHATEYSYKMATFIWTRRQGRKYFQYVKGDSIDGWYYRKWTAEEYAQAAKAFER